MVLKFETARPWDLKYFYQLAGDFTSKNSEVETLPAENFKTMVQKNLK